MLPQTMVLTYYMHSGFSCAVGDTLLVFDYWRGEHDELPDAARITAEQLRGFKKVYVFISHSHPDHFDPIVYSWREEAPVTYIVSHELPVGTRGKRMYPGDTLSFEDGLTVSAYDSTDLGVSFLVDVAGIRVFHAGDLNFWHWREESTLAEIEEAETAFRTAVAPLERLSREPDGTIDVAFFPVDPRQGSLFDAGANYFIMSCKPRLMIPMHFWERAEIAVEFARRGRTRETEIIAMTRPGENVVLEFDAEGFMPVNLPPAPIYEPQQVDPSVHDGPDPFVDTDLPVTLDENEQTEENTEEQ